MSSSVMTTVEGVVVVVTHVHPAPQGAQVLGAPQGAGQKHCGTIQKFSKSRPLVLGTVQIMVGLIILLFGIAMAVDADSLGVFCGIFIWGAAFYIAAGALTVAAGKYLTRFLVNTALALCVIAALASATATIFYSIDAANGTFYTYNCSPWQHDCCSHEIWMQGVSGVLAVFNLLELIVSLTIAGYACNATCNCTQEPMSVVVVPAAPMAAQAAPKDQVACVPAAEFSSQMLNDSEQPGAPGLMEPPIYISIV